MASFRQAPLWNALALNDIITRYRGSVLGPFWITLTTAAFALGVGLVYAEIMRVPSDKYLPWITAGVVFWNFMATTIIEGSVTFISEGVVIRQSSTPLPLFVWRVVWRNIINFAHQLVVLIAVAVYFGYIMKIHVLTACLGMIVLTLNVSWMCFLSGMVSARFRDVQQIIATALQLLFFVSPVIWIPGEGAHVHQVLTWNPAYHMLEVTRNPMLGMDVPMNSFVYLTVMAVVGWVVTFLAYSSVRRRIVHYL